MTSTDDQHWMRLALEEAKEAMEYAEIPVASILVGDGTEVARGQTQVRRRESIAAHGELYAILDAKSQIYKYSELSIYTTLEPCLMCLGACAQAGVTRVVFGMRAAPDGAAHAAEHLPTSLNLPKVVGGILEDDEIALMHQFADRFPDSPAIEYVQAMLAPYDGMS